MRLSAVLTPRVNPNTCGWRAPTRYCSRESTILSAVLAVQEMREMVLSLVILWA